MGNKLQKLYFRLLSASILALLCINIISFLAGVNHRQLINLSFFDERVTALYYLAKNIVLETGVNLDTVPQEDIDILLEKASDIYDVDKNMLAVLISKPHQYSLTVTGGMGLTTISCYDFLNSSFSNPYNSEENIMAAAETISKLQKSGMSKKLYNEKSDIFKTFLHSKNVGKKITMLLLDIYYFNPA